MPEIFSNYFLNRGLLCWFLAQMLKVIVTLCTDRKFLWERIVGAGGMPSSHSALVCGLATAVYIRFGFASYEFAVAVILALIVMYDAMGVRRAAGEQAKTINKLVNWYVFNQQEEDSPPEFDGRILKELLGHKPIEVLAGALLGIAVVLILPK